MPGTNRISGDLVFNAPIDIKIANNKFTSITIEDKTQLVYCDISYNPIPINFTNILPMCIQDYTAENYTEFVLPINDTVSSLSFQTSTTSTTSTLSSTVTTTFLTTMRRSTTSPISYLTNIKMTKLTTIKLPIPSTSSTTATIFDYGIKIDFYYYPFQLLKCFVDFSLLVYLLYKLYKRRFGKANIHLNRSDL